MNALYWLRIWPEARQRIDSQRRNPRSWRERLAELVDLRSVPFRLAPGVALLILALARLAQL